MEGAIHGDIFQELGHRPGLPLPLFGKANFFFGEDLPFLKIGHLPIRKKGRKQLMAYQ